MEMDISIHEVAKTSTTKDFGIKATSSKFQSTRSQRPRPPYSEKLPFPVVHFNPRGRKDLDSVPLYVPLQTYHFNPRGRKDLDKIQKILIQTQNISIHEVAKTSTVGDFPVCFSSTFQSTRSQRPRHFYNKTLIFNVKFQSTRSQRPRL